MLTIQDEFTHLRVSRGRRWQLRKEKEGLCQTCGKPSEGRACCDDCSIRKNHVTYRKPLKSEWAKVNWRLPNGVIAFRWGVTPQAVIYQRKKRALKKKRK